jgi:DNA repair photolyase
VWPHRPSGDVRRVCEHAFVRWSQQILGDEGQQALPGYRDAVVRHFDAPEAIGTRFWEVRAKSILNEVPPASQVPFRWTVNPYRGCSHACAYCLSGDTAVLMADGTTREIRSLQAGDVIVGTRVEGPNRRYVMTDVRDQWCTSKQAYEVELEDGTRLVASEEHRFLSTRGWQHVTGIESGRLRRPHLTPGSRLQGPGEEAIALRRTIVGAAVDDRSATSVVAVRPLGEVMQMYDITTGTGDFIANGVVSHNCFARPTHEFLGWNAGRDFEREIVVKVNAPERLRVELRRPSWAGEHVALGTNTDPYQWVEGRYELMPGIWAALRDARNPCSVLTKSPLLLRDLTLMKELNAVTDFSAALSIPTLDRRAWRASEPRTPNPRARIEAVAELTRAGIRTGVLVAPLMPGINDSPEQVAEILRLVGEAGASYVSGIALHLRKGVRQVFMEWLAEYRPDLVEGYEELYRRSAYLPPAERRRLTRLVDGGATTDPTRFLRGRRLTETSSRAYSDEAAPPRPAHREPEQARLF